MVIARSRESMRKLRRAGKSDGANLRGFGKVFDLRE
jgi:hypothetical protein